VTRLSISRTAAVAARMAAMRELLQSDPAVGYRLTLPSD